MSTQANALIASDFVVCVTLRVVPDVFNAGWLWNRVRNGQEGVLLLGALKRHPRRVVRTSGQRQETYYSHVHIYIPERDYVRDQRLEEGFGCRALLQELQRLHERDLGSHLAENDTIRYRLEPDPSLRSGEVRALFGRAIYLPADDEAPAFRIEVADDEQQGSWEEVGLIYPNQRLTLLNGDRRTSSFAVMNWPFPGNESILLLQQPGTPTLVNVMEEPPACLSLSDDDQGGVVACDQRNRELRLRVVALAVDAKLPASSKQISPASHSEKKPLTPVVNLANASRAVPDLGSSLGPDPLSDPPLDLGANPFAATDGDYAMVDHWGRREPVLGIPVYFEESPVPPISPEFSSALTPVPTSAPTPVPTSPAPASAPTPVPAPAPALDQHTWIPKRPAVYIRVAGVALQRLSTYATAGISDWRISFSRAGELVLDRHPDAAARLRIDSADQLFGEVAEESTPLALPGRWQPFPELDLEFIAAPSSMTTHYLGWVWLPTPLALPVPRERAVSFGRGSEADIAPRLLTDPRSLRWEGDPNKSAEISAEYLGLSRRHLRLQARRDDWWVSLESQSMPVYRLASSGDLLDVLTPGVDTATAAKPGDLLVAGGYVLALGAVE